jgi:hypothetical protein
MENSAAAVIAVSVVRGEDPSGPDEATGPGVSVWSFDPDELEDDPSWPARQASGFLALEFARQRGITRSEGADQMMDAMQQAIDHARERRAGAQIATSFHPSFRRRRRTTLLISLANLDDLRLHGEPEVIKIRNGCADALGRKLR